PTVEKDCSRYPLVAGKKGVDSLSPIMEPRTQNVSAPGNDDAFFQLDHSVRKQQVSGSVRASNAPCWSPQAHQPRAAIVAVSDTELLGKVAHTVFVVSIFRPDVIDSYPDLV